MHAVLLRYVIFGILIVESLCISHSRVGGPSGSVPGGPVDVPTNDFRVIQAAFFTIRQLGPGHILIWIRRAQMQVVAGTNYFLWLTILKFGVPRNCRATVWHKLDGTRELTSTTC